MRKIGILIIILLQIAQLVSQTMISGSITSATGDTISGVNVFLKDGFDGSTTDEYGNFKFTTSEAGNKLLIASMIGYEPFQKEVLLSDKPLTILIVLTEKVNELNTVTISAGQFETGDVKKMAALNSIDIVTTAGATADIFGALKTLPGIQPAAESNGLFVRGGDAYESKTFFDGMLVNKPFTSELPDIARRGRFSPFMFKGTSFSTGAYSAQYGDALSSTMSLESKDVSPKSKTDIGIMSVGFDATHIHRFKNSSIDLNASYYNLTPVFSIVQQNTRWTHAPEAFHANAFYKMTTGKNGIWKIYGNFEHSYVGLISYDFSDITKNVEYKVKSDNVYFNTTWQQYIGDTWKVNMGAGYGNDENNIDIDTNIVYQKEKSLHARGAITHYFGKLSDIKAGVEYFNYSDDESFNQMQHRLTHPLIASFIESNYYITSQFALRLGGRYEHAEVIHAGNLAPRISLAYKWNDVSQVSFGYGRFYQVPGDDFLFDSKTIDFENASHYVFNYQYHKEKRTFRAEAYYKKYDKLVKENSLDGSGLDNSGYGHATGFDLFYRDTRTIRQADFWITYSFLDTKRNYHHYPNEATPTFAAKHVANIVGKYFITGISTSIGATYTYASGRTYYNPNNQHFLSDRTRDYHNFSVNVSYLTTVARQFTIVYLSVENIFGITNVFGYRYSPDGSFRKPILPSAPRSIFLGIFVTFGDSNYR